MAEQTKWVGRVKFTPTSDSPVNIHAKFDAEKIGVSDEWTNSEADLSVTAINVDYDAFFNPDNWIGNVYTDDHSLLRIDENNHDMMFYPNYFKVPVSHLLKVYPHIKFTLFHNNNYDGRQAFGIYNPVKDLFIGYMSENMGRSNGSANGAYNELSKTGKTNEYTLGVKQDIHIDFSYYDNRYIIMTMEWEDGNENETMTIPMSENMNDWYFSLVNYRRGTMYIC